MVYDDQSELFAALVLPRVGRFHLQGMNNGTPVFGIDVLSHGAIAPIMRQLNAQRRDAFFTLAAHTVSSSRKAQPTIQALRAFWLDIDVGKTDTAVATQLEAIAAVQRLSDKLGIPAPSVIVSSGSGLHVYWGLDIELDYQTWTAYARNFKDAVTAAEPAIAADTSTWALATTVLRWPGTYNYKGGQARPVEILGGSFQRCALATFRAFAPTPEQFEAATQKLSAAHFVVPPDRQTPFDKRTRPAAATMEAHCPAVREYIRQESEGLARYPLWMTAMRLAAYTAEMVDTAHRWAAGPNYNQQSVDIKFFHFVEQRRAEGEKEQGPPRCDAFCKLLGFENNRPALCSGCPLFGKNSSPAHVSKLPPIPRMSNKAIAEVDDVPGLLAQSADVPDMLTGANGFNTPFRIITRDPSSAQQDEAAGQLHFTLTPGNTTTQNTAPNSGALLSTPFWFVSALTGDVNRGDIYYGYKLDPVGAPVRIGLRARDLAYNKTARTALAGQSIRVLVPDNREGWEVLDRYISDVTRAVQLYVRRPIEQLGWQPDTSRGPNFAAAGVIVDRHGFTPYEPIGSLADRPEVVARGNSTDAIAALQAFHRVATPLTQILTLASFASPLARLSGAPGILVSVYGKTGIGKSAFLGYLADIWASRSVTLPSGKSTVKGLELLRTNAGSLMFSYEETGSRGADSAFALAFGVTDATNRASVDVVSGRTRKVMPMPTDGYVLSASNSSVLEAAGRAGLTAEREAAMARIVEFEHDGPMFELTPGDEARIAMRENCGMVGLIYAKYVVDNYAAIQKRIKYHFQRISANSSGGDRRFVFSWYAVTMAAAEILSEQGLIDYRDADKSYTSLDALLRHYAKFDEARKATLEVNARSVLSQMVSELAGFEAVFAPPNGATPPTCTQTPAVGRATKVHLMNQIAGGQHAIIPVKVIVDTLREKFGDRSGQGYVEIMRKAIDQGLVDAGTNPLTRRRDNSAPMTFLHSMSPYGLTPPVECVRVKF